MQIRVPCFIALMVAVAAAAAGCGDSESNGTTTTTTSSSAASSSGMGDQTVNGCTAAMAQDETGKTDVTITFTGISYSPSCVKVSKGTNVTFSGSFDAHPLVGGEFANGMKTPDASSPIKATSTGMTATFTLDTPGDYPFYCDVHASVKMYGVVYVE